MVLMVARPATREAGYGGRAPRVVTKATLGPGVAAPPMVMLAVILCGAVHGETVGGDVWAEVQCAGSREVAAPRQ